MDDTLRRLLTRYRECGDEEAVEEFVRRTRPRLLAVARRIGQPQDAEDTAQSAYLSLFSRSAGVPEAPLVPWLVTACVRIAYRKKALGERLREVARRLARPAETEAAAPALDAEELATLRRDVGSLPDAYRDAVVLHYLEGLPNSEAAHLLGISEGALRVRLHRARGALRRRWSERVGFGLLLLPHRLRDRLTHLAGPAAALLSGKAALAPAAVLVLAAGATTAAVVTMMPGSADPRHEPAAAAVVRGAVAGGITTTEEPVVDPATPEPDTEPETLVVEQRYVFTDALKSRREMRRTADGDLVPHGLSTWWYPDGTTREMEGTFRDGREHGRFTHWHEDGRKAAEGDYADGEEEGLWREWKEDGSRLEAEYERGVWNGRYESWYGNGRKEFEGEYRAGSAHGKRLGWYVDGTPAYVEQWNDGTRNGVQVHYWRSGSKRYESTYRDGLRHGLSRLWNEDGSLAREGDYRDGLLEGPFTFFHSNGRVATRTNYVAGRLEGEAVGFHPNGQVALRSSYRDNLIDGPWVTYDVDGTKLSEGAYVRGQREGLWRTWGPGDGTASEVTYENGVAVSGREVQTVCLGDRVVVLSDTEFKDGRRHGRARTWWHSGRPGMEGEYRDGVPVGPWSEWDPTGRLVREGRYVDGKFDGVVRTYDPRTGALVSEVVWADGKPQGPRR